MNEQPDRFRWPLNPKDDQEARKLATAMGLERHKRNWTAFDEGEWPVLEKASGREMLAFFRAQDYNWWQLQLATHPNRARYYARQYAILAKRYGPINQLVAT